MDLRSGKNNTEERRDFEKIVSSGAISRECAGILRNVPATLDVNDEQNVHDKHDSDPISLGPLPPDSDKGDNHPTPIEDLDSFDYVEDKDIALGLMYKLSPQEIPYDGTKSKWLRLPESYKKWNKMNARQREVTRGYWSNLSPEVKRKVMLQVHSETEVMVRQKMAQRAPKTTVNDKIRLLHVRAEPSLQATWHQILNSYGNQKRQLMDAQRSHASPDRDEALNPWTKIAAIFNDRDGVFQPQNCAVMYVQGDQGFPVKVSLDSLSGKAVPASPAVPQQMAQDLYDLDPNEQNRPMRDAQWCKEKFGELKTDISKCWSRFDRSGENSNNKYSLEGRAEWHTRFADKFDQTIQYAILVLDEMLDNLGKQLPPGTNRDTGIITDSSQVPIMQQFSSQNSGREISNTPSAVYKRRYREKRARTENNSPRFASQLDMEMETAGDKIARAIKESSQVSTSQEIRMQALLYLAGRKTENPILAEKAENELAKLAFEPEIGSNDDPA